MPRNPRYAWPMRAAMDILIVRWTDARGAFGRIHRAVSYGSPGHLRNWTRATLGGSGAPL